MSFTKQQTLHARDTSQAIDWAAVTPNDGADLARVPSYLMVGVSGNVVITSQDGNDATVYMVAGVVYPFCPVRIKATNTTATGIVALYGYRQG